MCPLRFILVFFSALLAGYFAWKTVRSSPEEEEMFGLQDSSAEKISSKTKQEFSLIKVLQNGFWVFIDMASGKYIWRNLKEMKNKEKAKSF